MRCISTNMLEWKNLIGSMLNQIPFSPIPRHTAIPCQRISKSLSLNNHTMSSHQPSNSTTPASSSSTTTTVSQQKQQQYLLCPKCLITQNQQNLLEYRLRDDGWLIGVSETERGKQDASADDDSSGNLDRQASSCSHYIEKPIIKSIPKFRSSGKRSRNGESASVDSSSNQEDSRNHLEALISEMKQSQHTNHDIEALPQKFHSRRFAIPLIVDLHLVKSSSSSDAGEIRDEEALRRDFDLIMQKCRHRDVVLRLTGKLASNLVDLNRRTHQILIWQRNWFKRRRSQSRGSSKGAQSNPTAVILDLGSERLSLLMEMEESVLLEDNVYPEVHIYADKGQEQEAAKELLLILEKLQHATGIQLIVNLIINRPYPDLVSVMALLRNYRKICKLVLIEVERSPGQIMKQLKEEEPSNDELEESDPNTEASNNEHLNLDPTDLLLHIEKCSAGTIHASDFFPASYGMMMEPFLRWLKIGNFRIRPAPECAFCTVLINSKYYESEPVTRILDVPYLYQEVMKLFPRLQKIKNFPGFLLTRKLKKVFKTAGHRHGSNLPNILSYMITLDSEKRAYMEQVMTEMQFIVVHNKMDIGCIDAKRRALCSMCELGGKDGGEFIAQCTNGIV